MLAALATGFSPAVGPGSGLGGDSRSFRIHGGSSFPRAGGRSGDPLRSPVRPRPEPASPRERLARHSAEGAPGPKRSRSFWYSKCSARHRSPRATSGASGLDLLDLRQQLVQVRPDDGLAHLVDQVRRQARQRLGRELGPLLRGRGRGLLGVEELDPQVGLDLPEQLGLLERLADEVVGADPQQLLAVLVQGAGGHGDDLGLLAAGGGPDPADRLVAVHHRHAEIHQDQVGPPALELLDGLLPVARQPDLEADGAEELHQQLAVILDVVGDQHPALRLPGPEPQDVAGLVDRGGPPAPRPRSGAGGSRRCSPCRPGCSP